MKRAIGILLAGVLCAAMCIGLAGCGGQKAFYTLEEAYEAELLTYEDLQQIHHFHQVEPYPTSLTVEESDAIQQSFFENSEDILENMGLKNIKFESPDEINVLWFYGCYEGYYAIAIKIYDSDIAALDQLEIAGLEFMYSYGIHIFIWTNPDGIEF